MSERTSPVVDAGDRVGWTATFITSKGFFYRGKLIGIIGSTYMMGTQMQAYPPTHYRIYDIKTGQEMDLLITSIETIKWEKLVLMA